MIMIMNFHYVPSMGRRKSPSRRASSLGVGYAPILRKAETKNDDIFYAPRGTHFEETIMEPSLKKEKISGAGSASEERYFEM